jgi:hypothetical protein
MARSAQQVLRALGLMAAMVERRVPAALAGLGVSLALAATTGRVEAAVEAEAGLATEATPLATRLTTARRQSRVEAVLALLPLLEALALDRTPEIPAMVVWQVAAMVAVVAAVLIAAVEAAGTRAAVEAPTGLAAEVVVAARMSIQALRMLLSELTEVVMAP